VGKDTHQIKVTSVFVQISGLEQIVKYALFSVSVEEASIPTALHAHVHLDIQECYVRQILMSVPPIPVSTMAYAGIKSMSIYVAVPVVLLA
jgi:hypothetical protein